MFASADSILRRTAPKKSSSHVGVQAGLEQVRRLAGAASVGAGGAARVRSSAVDGRPECRGRHGARRPRLPQRRHGRAQVQVRLERVADQLGQLRVVEDAPPLADLRRLGRRYARLGGRGDGGAVPTGRDRRFRLRGMVVRPDHAAGRKQRRHADEARGQPGAATQFAQNSRRHHSHNSHSSQSRLLTHSAARQSGRGARPSTPGRTRRRCRR